MYDIDINYIKKGKKFYGTFLIFGLIFLAIFSIFFLQDKIKIFYMDSSVVSSRVEIKVHERKGNTLYSPVYYYKVNNKVYSCNSNIYSKVKPEIKNKRVYYDSKNPSYCTINNNTFKNITYLLFLILPVSFTLLGLINIIKINKRIKVILMLNKKGKLIKNIPYKMEETGISVNNVPILRMVIDYTLPSGEEVILYGDPIYDSKNINNDELVNLLIYEDNPKNYFIDFEINRLSGNLPEDYFDNNNQA